MTEPRMLILETSDRMGQIALAEGRKLLAVRHLDETRRHARDLAPTVKELLAAQGWRPAELTGVIVSRGPGSYTGLRVGITSAKTLAYATGCALVAVDTFAAIAHQSDRAVDRVDVLADAQQDKIYLQSFGREVTGWQPLSSLAIVAFSRWLVDRMSAAAVTGPGLRKWAEHLPQDVPVVDRTRWEVRIESLLHLGLARYEAGDRDDPFALEPIYLRPSSAEEQWDRRKDASGTR